MHVSKEGQLKRFEENDVTLRDFREGDLLKEIRYLASHYDPNNRQDVVHYRFLET